MEMVAFSLMKPLDPNLLRTNNEVRADQEKVVLDILQNSDYSMTATNIFFRRMNGTLLGFPGYETEDDIPASVYGMRGHRAIANVLRRLENKGKVISALYNNKRYYSVPVIQTAELERI